MKDYKSKKERRTKKPTHYNFFDAHFNLADKDDFFGYDSNERSFTLIEVFVGLGIILPVVFAIVYFLLALTPNI